MSSWLQTNKNSYLPMYKIASRLLCTIWRHTWLQKIGRKLLYLKTTRFDISWATHQLNQFLSSPTATHYDTTCKVVKYGKRSPRRRPVFIRKSNIQFLGFTDVDWIGCIDTRRSNSGYFFFIGSTLVSWRAKKQQIFSRSSSEAEYRVLSFASCKLQWLIYLLQDLGIQCNKLLVIYCGSQSVIHVAANPIFTIEHNTLKLISTLCRKKSCKVSSNFFQSSHKLKL